MDSLDQEPAWMAVARAEIGVAEIPGTADNPRIQQYRMATSTKLGTAKDEVPWCSDFANWVMQQAGYEGTQSEAARSWLHWGHPLGEPRVGCITVLRRGTQVWQGHVGFYLGRASGRVLLLAGNQSNAVSVAAFDPATVLGYRWPTAQ